MSWGSDSSFHSGRQNRNQDLSHPALVPPGSVRGTVMYPKPQGHTRRSLKTEPVFPIPRIPQDWNTETLHLAWGKNPV